MSKEENVEYRKRPGAYAIIVNKDDDKVGIVTDGEAYFYLGGGIENGETKLEALKREMIEEAGLGVAMGNSTPVIKEVANVEVGTNNEEGVRETFQKYIK